MAESKFKANRLPPGPVKRFTGYFTIPIDEAIYAGMETLKWRVKYDKTEIARRLLEYFLALPQDSQDKLLESFNLTRQREGKEARMKRKMEAYNPASRLRTVSPMRAPEPEPVKAVVKPEYVSPERNLVTGKRSGLP